MNATCSYGVIASLLIRLDARLDEWHSVGDLAQHFGLQMATVREHLESMCHDGLVRVQRSDAGGQIIAALIGADMVREGKPA